MSLRERSIMILDALSTEHGPETFVSDGYAYYEDALGALIAFAREIRNEVLEEAAIKTIEMGRSVKGGYNNAAFEIAQAIRNINTSSEKKL